MTKKNLWLVLPALALLFGMLVAACAGDDNKKEEELTAEDKIADYIGTYTAEYKRAANDTKDFKETIKFEERHFEIGDNYREVMDLDKSPGGQNFLHFNIKEWAEIDTPDEYKEQYPVGFRFTGGITSQQGSIGSSADTQTGPGFVSSDVRGDGNGTKCWMDIYFGTSADRKRIFIRTPLSKEGLNNNYIVKSYTGGPERIYVWY